MKITSYKEALEEEQKGMPDAIRIVNRIISDVRQNGDKAVRKYSLKFDRTLPRQVGKAEIKRAYRMLAMEDIVALKKAAARIRRFAKRQLKNLKGFKLRTKGYELGLRFEPIERAGCYVPGGRYPLPSSALMSVITAKAAGVKEAIVCSPKIKPATIVAADMAGADMIFDVGGAHAIAAMAYGTETIPKADKIVGPGNKYVTAAKKAVYGEVGIDFIAGPTELVAIADKKANPKFIAADLLSTAEHDTEAKVTLITDSAMIAKAVLTELKTQLTELTTSKVARKAIKKGKIIVVKDLMKAARIANELAPEHLELQIRNSIRLIPKLKNYGALFIGAYTTKVFGDYSSGTNHILPTGKAAKYAGGLSVMDFVRAQTYQRAYGKKCKAIPELAKAAAKIAEMEGLEAHKKAALIRLKQTKQ